MSFTRIIVFQINSSGKFHSHSILFNGESLKRAKLIWGGDLTYSMALQASNFTLLEPWNHFTSFILLEDTLKRRVECIHQWCEHGYWSYMICGILLRAIFFYLAQAIILNHYSILSQEPACLHHLVLPALPHLLVKNFTVAIAVLLMDEGSSPPEIISLRPSCCFTLWIFQPIRTKDSIDVSQYLTHPLNPNSLIIKEANFDIQVVELLDWIYHV